MCDRPGCTIVENNIEMARFLTGLGQASGSSDCGFFCCYALKLLFVNAGNPEGTSRRPAQVSPLQVYQAREHYLHTPPAQQILTHRHNAFLDYQGALNFLSGDRGLNVRATYQNHSVAGQTNATVWGNVSDYKGANRRHGVMLRLLGGSAGAQGHWIAVLQVDGTRLRIYDPSDVPLEGPRCMSWLDVGVATRRYSPYAILSVLSTAHP